MLISGIILEVDCVERLIKVETKYRIYYIKIGKSLYNKVKTFLGERTIVILDGSLNKKSNFYHVNYFTKIYSLDNEYLCYDDTYLKKSLAKFMNSHKNIMFLDLEFSMPEYDSRKPFKPEIIQVGYILVDENKKEILRYSEYVIPNCSKLSIRTCKFLNIFNREFYKKAISPRSFYRDFEHILKKYDPHIIVYGRNDILALKDFYLLNNLVSLERKTKFVNLLSLIQNYYHLDNSLGLFSLYEKYYKVDTIQDHDAYTDAYITSLVYFAFKEDVINLKRSILND